MMKTKSLFLAGLLLCTGANAQTADQLKQSSLEACDLQSAAVPEAQRKMVLDICQCGVENTDYEMMLAAQSDPEKMKELQAKSMKIAQQCATKASS